METHSINAVAEFGVPKKAFKLQTSHLSDALSQLKWKLVKLSELKRAGKKVTDPLVQELDHKN